MPNIPLAKRNFPAQIPLGKRDLPEGPATYVARVGIGHDTHRLRPGGPIRLGGIDIPSDSEMVGHSDADVLLHAVTDALLGAAGLGDIGEMFPDTAAENRGRDSAEMLRVAKRAITVAGWEIANLDCIVHAERPKLGPLKQVIRGRLAEILEIAPEQVSVKAKTGERVGPVGRQEAIEAQCVASLCTKSSPAAETSCITPDHPKSP